MKFVGIIAEPLGMLLSWLYGQIGEYGITLIVFTLIVRGCLFPLYANQIKHSAKMMAVQPKMQEIQRKYANDKETMNIKMMELYKEEHFNPLRGCLPMIIQLPIIWALFALLRNPTMYMDSNIMWMASHESFLWIHDLSQPDSWILPILAGVSTYFSFSLTQSQSMQGTAGAGQMAPMMNMMKYFFPIMIVWMGRSFPAGLALYWFIGTLVQIVQTKGLSGWKRKLMVNKDEE